MDRTRFVANGSSRLRQAATDEVRRRVNAEFEPQLANAGFVRRLRLRYLRRQRLQAEIERLPNQSPDDRLF